MQHQGDKIPGIYKRNPREVMNEIVKRWIDAEEAEKAERAIDVTSAQESRTEAETAVPPPDPDDGIDGELA